MSAKPALEILARNLIPSLTPVLAKLQDAGLYLDRDRVARVLQLAREA